MKVDYLVVGSGLTGATIARLLHDSGASVVVVDRRSHLGGNVYDHTHASGIRVHTYGPHYFRTSSEKIWEFVNRFSQWYSYEACLKTLVDGHHQPWPVTTRYLREFVGEQWSPEFTGKPANFEEASLAMMPRLVYEKFVKGYTEKQWGVPASALSAQLAKRFDVREGDDPRLMQHKHQGLPMEGYAGFMSKLLQGIPVILNFDYLREREQIIPRRKVIFTGPIDEYFGFDLGRLVYRGQRRDHTYIADAEFVLPCGQVNNPSALFGPHIRTLEWKYMMPAQFRAKIRGTVITQETPHSPQTPNEYEYPFPDAANSALYARYRERAEAMPNLLICGRLGEYQYYDMDQAIGRAMMLAERLLDYDRGEISASTPSSKSNLSVDLSAKVTA